MIKLSWLIQGSFAFHHKNVNFYIFLGISIDKNKNTYYNNSCQYLWRSSSVG